MFLPMARVEMIGVKRSLESTVRLLHRLGTVQIDRWNEARSPFQRHMMLDSDTLRLRERLAYFSARVEALLETLPDVELSPSSDEESSNRSPAGLLDLIERGLAEVEPQAQVLVTRRDQLEHQLASLPRYEATLQQLLPLLPGFLDLQHYALTAIWLERRHQAVLDAVTERLGR